MYVKDVSTGQCWTFSTDKAGYRQALNRWRSIEAQGHIVESNKQLWELEYGAS